MYENLILWWYVVTQSRLEEQLKCKLLALLSHKASMTQEVRMCFVDPKLDYISEEREYLCELDLIFSIVFLLSFHQFNANASEQVSVVWWSTCHDFCIAGVPRIWPTQMELLDTILQELDQQLSSIPKSDLIAQEPNMSRMLQVGLLPLFFWFVLHPCLADCSQKHACEPLCYFCKHRRINFCLVLQDIRTRTFSHVSRSLIPSEFISEVPYHGTLSFIHFICSCRQI